MVETGVDKGLGAVVLCAAILRNRAEGNKSRYYGTDIDPHAGCLLCGPYKQAGEILYGDSIESLRGMQDKIGVFVNDRDHSASYELEEYKTVLPLLHLDSVIREIMRTQHHQFTNFLRRTAATSFFGERSLSITGIQAEASDSVVVAGHNRKICALGASRWPGKSIVPTPW